MTDNENSKTPESSEVKNEKRAPVRRRPAVKKAAEAKDSKIEKPRRTQARPAKPQQEAQSARARNIAAKSHLVTRPTLAIYATQSDNTRSVTVNYIPAIAPNRRIGK